MQQQLTKQTPEGFLLVGRIDAPEQPKAAVVIVHGLCEHFGRYDYVTQRLLEAGYAVVRFDHRGHGRSMGKKVWYDDRTQIVSDTDLFVEEARAQFPDLPVFMIGHSMGGFGAASYGTAHPGKLDGYVLSGAWTRDHASLASGAVEQGLDPETYIPNELGDGECPDPLTLHSTVEDDDLSYSVASVLRSMERTALELEAGGDLFDLSGWTLANGKSIAATCARLGIDIAPKLHTDPASVADAARRAAGTCTADMPRSRAAHL